MIGLLGMLGLPGKLLPTREICHGDRRQATERDGVVSPVASRVTVLIGGGKPRQHPQQHQQGFVLRLGLGAPYRKRASTVSTCLHGARCTRARRAPGAPLPVPGHTGRQTPSSRCTARASAPSNAGDVNAFDRRCVA
jgi:hypothetical protein